MFFNKERKEIKNIYKQLLKIMNFHNQRPMRSSTFDGFSLKLFSNKIKGSIISTNRYGSPEMYGVEIELEKIEENEKYLCFSITPIKITMELWDKNRKELMRELADKFNASKEPFNNIKGLKERNGYKVSKTFARIDKEYGLQFYTKYKYEKLFIEELWFNFSNLSQYADLSSGLIKESYI